MTRHVLIGTRRSALAMAQTNQVAQALAAATGWTVELVEITTAGDVSREHLTQIGGTGVFVSALREALARHDVDLAVHSLKDLPTAPAPGLVLAAVPRREDPRDVLCARDGLGLADLPAGSRIGTGSPRRVAQLNLLGLGLQMVPVRGNVETRLRMVQDGRLDAVVLARAGLARLGLLDAVTEVLDPMQMLPAPGQGALAVECRANDGSAASAGDAELIRALTDIDDPPSRAAVLAERTLLSVLEAGCMAPVGAYSEVADGDAAIEIYLRAVVAAPDGSESIRKSITGPVAEAEQLGRQLALELLDDGAGDLVGEPSREPQEETVP